MNPYLFRLFLFLATSLPCLTASCVGSEEITCELRTFFAGCNKSARQFIRLAFHDAGTYDSARQTGGADGSIQFELHRTENIILASAVEYAQSVALVYGISVTDAIMYGAAIANEVCGGLPLSFKFGRVDALTANSVDLLPSENATALETRQIIHEFICIVTGLSWTSHGDGALLHIEATCHPGKGQLQLTGRLGEVMRESALLALSWLRANSLRLKLYLNWQERDIHLHFPAGAVSKDGPSAGIAILTALVSLFVQQPVRQHIAMTGELTLRGIVLPVGGIKEKLLAAHRGGIKYVIIPLQNEKDAVADIPAHIREEMKIVLVRSVDQVLVHAFSDSVFINTESLASMRAERL